MAENIESKGMQKEAGEGRREETREEKGDEAREGRREETREEKGDETTPLTGRIYRHSNKRVGFDLDTADFPSANSLPKSITTLIASINHHFLICSNRQTECILKGSIDPHNTLTSLFMAALIVPILKAVMLDHF